jgi:hypothetical protein
MFTDGAIRGLLGRLEPCRHPMSQAEQYVPINLGGNTRRHATHTVCTSQQKGKKWINFSVSMGSCTELWNRFSGLNLAFADNHRKQLWSGENTWRTG